MDTLLMLKALIMGVVEGLTEFLPVSSTGHLILAGSLLDFWSKDKRDVFDVFIQMGAMLAVVWEFRQRFTSVVMRLPSDPQAQRFVVNVLIAFLPAALLGLLFGHKIKELLFHPTPVALAFIVGGIIILWAEKRLHVATIASADDLRWKDALKVGLAQSLALIPGTSRSGATIIGGLFFGLSRRAATEFSFFLAVPTLSAASIYSMWKVRHQLTASDLDVFAIGFVASFIAALVVIKGLLRFIANHTFVVFAWYRIVFGLLVLLTAHFGWVNWSG